MDFVIDFLVNNYMWFLVITLILIFALVGYIVDSREHKEVSIFDSPQELAKNLEMLAASAQNRTIGEAMQNQGGANLGTNVNGPVNNTIVENSVGVNQTGLVMPNPVNYQNTTYPSMNPNSTGTGMVNSNQSVMPAQVMPNQTVLPQNSNPVSSFEVLGK